jgi:hypothetical protein
MADNTVLPGAGETFATNDIGGVKYQRVKLVLGAAGAADMDLDSGQQTAANCAPVVLPAAQLGGMTSLPNGTNNIGDVDVLTVPADPFGVNADASSATGSISAKLRYIAAQVAKPTIATQATAAITDTTVTTVHAAAGASTKWRIAAFTIQNSHASVGTWVTIQDDTGTPVVYWKVYCAPGGGGATLNFTEAMEAKGQANGKINVVCGTTGANVIASVNAYKVAA